MLNPKHEARNSKQFSNDRKRKNFQQTKQNRLWIYLVVIAILGFAVYANSLQGEFLWDDESLVKDNPYIKSWSYLGKIFLSSLGTSAGSDTAFYRPVQVLSYMADYSFWKLNVLGFHLTNVLVHILASLSLFWLIQQLFKDARLSFLTALFFVLHPIHTEAVAYISGRADPLAALFMFLTFGLYLKTTEESKKNFNVQIPPHPNPLPLTGARESVSSPLPRGAEGEGRVRVDERLQKSFTVLFMGASCVLALLSRENSVLLPLLILLYHFTFRKPVPKKWFFLLALIAAGYVLWRVALLSGLPQVSQGSTLQDRIPGMFVAFGNYIRLLFLPLELHMEYGGLLFSPADPKVLAGAAIFGAFAVLLVWARRKSADTFFCLGWFLIALLPASNVYALNAYMAEHWLYIPSVGFFLLLACFVLRLYDAEKWRITAVAVTASLAVAYGLSTAKHNSYWRTGIGLYTRVLQFAPSSSRLYNNLAKAYHDAGKDAELIKLLQTAIAIEPNNLEAYNNLGNALKEVGRLEEAISAYRKAIEINPAIAGPYYNLSLTYAKTPGGREEAKRLLKTAIESNPYYTDAYHKLGLILLEEGNAAEAIALLKQAMKLNPDNPKIYHSLGYVYVQNHQTAEAERMYRKAAEAAPSFAEAYHDLAVLYVSQGKYDLAREHHKRAASLGYNDPNLAEVLGAGK